MLYIYQSPLSSNTLTLLKKYHEADENKVKTAYSQAELMLENNVESRYEDIIVVPESFCRLPWPLMGEIFRYAATPFILEASQKCLAALMLVDKKSLAEVNRMLIINPVLRSEWIERKMRRCNDRIKVLANRNELFDDRIKSKLEEMQHISIDFNRIKNKEIRIKVLEFLSQKKDIKSFSIFADGLFHDKPNILINMIIKILENNKKLKLIKALSLCKNNLNAEHIQKLGDALSGRRIDLLNLDRNPIRKKGMEILASYLQNMKINTLQIENAIFRRPSIADFTVA